MPKLTPTALVVDDEPQVRELTSRALSRCGFVCDQARDGEEALRLVQSKSYGAVVTDLRMPVKHGHSLCVEALALPTAPPILVLTALTDPRIARDLMSRGVYDVVHKPVSYDALAEKVSLMFSGGRVVPASRARATPTIAKLNLLQRIETTLCELTELFADRLEVVFTDTDGLPDPPPAVREFIRRLAESEVAGSSKNAVLLPGNEDRTTDRVTCYTTAVAVPVDRKWNRNCVPFRVAVRDLSEGGIRLLHTRATNAEYLALEWKPTQVPAQAIRVVVRVMRCNPLSPFYDIGGQYVMAD
jgi:CheY-like chemotaxis protein